MKRLIFILLLIAAALPAFAQDKFASSFGLAGESDARALKEINARMDSIRRYRPTVALVLSGGGAKGAAHIGTLRKIEEMQQSFAILYEKLLIYKLHTVYGYGTKRIKERAFIRESAEARGDEAMETVKREIEARLGIK